MKKILTMGAILAMFAFAFVVSAEAPRPHRPDVVAEQPGNYVSNARWVTGVSQDGGAKGESLEMGPGFAFYAFQNWWDQDLADVTKIRASFKGDIADGGGSPRFSLLLDANGDGDYCDGVAENCAEDAIIYLDPFHCSDAVAGGWFESDFTGDRTNCSIMDDKGNTFVSDTESSAWEKVVAQYPDAVVWFLFLIQDSSPGTNYVDRIMLDSAFFTKAP